MLVRKIFQYPLFLKTNEISLWGGKTKSTTVHGQSSGSCASFHLFSITLWIIGEGFNSPPQNECLESCLKDTLPASFKSDKTCCVHAEQRAIMDALRRNSAKIERSQLYFIRLDEQGEKQYAGDPYCTICSKMALDVRIGEFVLWHEQGICVYDTKEYNARSFRFFPK